MEYIYWGRVCCTSTLGVAFLACNSSAGPVPCRTWVTKDSSSLFALAVQHVRDKHHHLVGQGRWSICDCMWQDVLFFQSCPCGRMFCKIYRQQSLDPIRPRWLRSISIASNCGLRCNCFQDLLYGAGQHTAAYSVFSGNLYPTPPRGGRRRPQGFWQGAAIMAPATLCRACNARYKTSWVSHSRSLHTKEKQPLAEPGDFFVWSRQRT